MGLGHAVLDVGCGTGPPETKRGEERAGGWGGGGDCREVSERGGQGGDGTQKLVYQKWPAQIFPIVKFVFSHCGHFGRAGGTPPPPVVYGHSNTCLGHCPFDCRYGGPANTSAGYLGLVGAPLIRPRGELLTKVATEGKACPFASRDNGVGGMYCAGPMSP